MILKGLKYTLEQEGYEVKRGKQSSVKSEKMDRFIRFRSLGSGYTEAELKKAIENNTVDHSMETVPPSPVHTFCLMKDFEQVLLQKKGKGYENWARHFNNTQAAEVLIFLQENYIDSREKLNDLVEKATDRFHALSSEIKTCEARLKEIGTLKKAITDYSKTRDTYEAYRKAGYSKKFFEDHREEITIHKAAKKIFDELPAKKIPKIKELSEEYSKVLSRKKSAYKEYREAKKEMQNYTIAQKNVSMLLGGTNVSERNAQPSRGA